MHEREFDDLSTRTYGRPCLRPFPTRTSCDGVRVSVLGSLNGFVLLRSVTHSRATANRPNCKLYEEVERIPHYYK